MEKKIFILIIALLSINFVFAENFEIDVVSHYYKDGYEFARYSEDMGYDGISFEIIGVNKLPTERIMNITIFGIYPEIFNKSIKQTEDTLRIKQEKKIFETNIIDRWKINDSEFFISVTGIGEHDKEIYYDEKNFNLDLIGEKGNESVFSGIGNSIWEGEPVKGMYVGVLVIGLMIFISWKYEFFGNLNKKMNDYRRKEKYRRIYGNQ